MGGKGKNVGASTFAGPLGTDCHPGPHFPAPVMGQEPLGCDISCGECVFTSSWESAGETED